MTPVQEILCSYLYCSTITNPDRVIRSAFRELRIQISGFGLDPGTLRHIGIPEIVAGQLGCYDCCMECPLPVDETKTLPGRRYAVLTLEKIPVKISAAIRSFRCDYIPAHGLAEHVNCPVYEIYFKDTLEHCLPIF